MGASSSNYSEWNIDDKWSFSRVEILWTVGSKNGETRRWQVCHRWWHGLWHRHRIEPFSKVTIILVKGEWSIAKDTGSFFKTCNARHRQTFYNLENVYAFNIGSICNHGKKCSENLHSIKKYREQTHLETDDRHTWKVDISDNQMRLM